MPLRPGPAASGDSTPGPAAAPQPDAGSAAAALEASVARLAELADLPVAAHVARYDALHGELSDALADIDGV